MGDERTPGENRSGDKGTDVSIPSPRLAPDNQVERPTPVDPRRPQWQYRQYRQQRKRCVDRNYTGEVESVDGIEGARLRAALSDVVRQLLEWADLHEEATALGDVPPDEGEPEVR